MEIVCTQKVPGVRISPSPPVHFSYKSYVFRIGLFLLFLQGFLVLFFSYRFVKIRLHSQKLGVQLGVRKKYNKERTPKWHLMI